MTTVRFGYEVGTGKPVEIPLRHMVITGQSQQAGKTTALEALVARSGVQAVAFITKRGEGSFADARTIRPYFAERTGDEDFLEWKYVASILEASLGEKLKFERSWIMRATKGARTLADVYDNVKAAIADPKTRGLSADVYYALGEYLKAIVPQIAKVRWATTVDLAPGVSAMDLLAINEPMQHLVIRSTLDWVLNNGDNTVVVIPEAWKFIPEGRGAPVKLAAESYIRQGAGLKNYLWLDSQDIAGVDKTILKQVTVWVLGVQRESNEVKRTLAQIPRRIKEPTPDAIATLKLGEFYVCHGEHINKVYAQPRWMGENEAQGIARGLLSAADAFRTAIAKGRERAAPKPDYEIVEDDVIDTQKMLALEEENARLTEENHTLRNDLNALSLRMKALERGAEVPTNGRGFPPTPPPSQRGTPIPSPELVPLTPDHIDDAYDMIVARLKREAPGILKVLTIKPELEVTVERQTIKLDGKSLRGRVVQLLAKGFFDEGSIQTHVRAELERHGASVSDAKNLPRELGALVEMGFLTIEDRNDVKGKTRKMYVAVPDMKVNVVKS
jgi:hypothetical protein